MPEIAQSNTDVAKLFKIVYDPESNNYLVNTDKVYSQIPKEVGSFGEKIQKTYITQINGSIGAGYGNTNGNLLPEVNTNKTIRPEFNFKRHYARIQLDHAVIANSKDKKGAIKEIYDYEVKEKIVSFTWNMIRQFYNDGTGVLAQFTNAATGTAAAPTFTINNTGRYRRRRWHFEPGLIVQVGVGASAPPYNTAPLTSKFTVTSYNASTGAVVLARISGSDDLTGLANGTYNVYIQDSYNSDQTGLFGITQDSTFYGVASQYNWQPVVIPGLTVSSLDNNMEDSELTLEVFNRMLNFYCTVNGDVPTHVLASPTQMRKIKNLLEDRGLTVRNTIVKANVDLLKSNKQKVFGQAGFSAMEYACTDGTVIIQEGRMLREDMIIAFDMSQIKQRFVLMPSWYDGDGNTWDRSVGIDGGSAYYRGYGEIMINPKYVGFLQNLSITE